MAIQWKRRLAAGLVLAVLPLIMTAGSLYFHCEEVRAAQVIKEEKGPYGCLTWPQNLNAVRSEVEIFKEIPKDLRADAPIATAIYRNTQVYTNSLMLDMRQLQAEKPLFYRVRAYDLDGHPIGPYSQPADVESALFKTERNAPIPHDPYGKGYGSVLCIRSMPTQEIRMPRAMRSKSRQSIRKISMASRHPSTASMRPRQNSPISMMMRRGREPTTGASGEWTARGSPWVSGACRRRSKIR